MKFVVIERVFKEFLFQSPGEGSLKIIEFIRTLKQTPGNTPNKLHCIYSGDNDYLMLGLATREPHVSFIQEVFSTIWKFVLGPQNFAIVFELYFVYFKPEFSLLISEKPPDHHGLHCASMMLSINSA